MKIINGFYRVSTFFLLRKYDILFGKRFRHGKFSCRKRMTILIEKGGELSIDTGCFFNNDCSITCMNKIKIGKNTIFGEGVKIYDHNYHINTGGVIKLSGHTLGEVTIGENCWIGANTVILKGARIGDNCIIGAGCIISTVIDDNTLIRTNPDMVQFKLNKT